MKNEVIEKLVFAQKSKTELIDETIISLQALLHKTFIEEDSRILKKEFPKNTHPKDLRIKLDNVIIHIESLYSPELSIEVILDIFLKKHNSELGTYSYIFNEKGDFIDDLLVMN
ncbi:MAG: hypothetical protein PF485_13745 [Bacteroidales bacterium]|jgi:hypothetical protein|nr:hypothetical protein [Bacteroidales bacterium]